MSRKIEIYNKKNSIRSVLLKGYREKILSNTICHEIEKLEKINKKKLIKIIDYGSGYNPIVIKKIIEMLSRKYKKTKFRAYCFDNYNKEQINLMNRSKDIKFMHVNIFKFTWFIILFQKSHCFFMRAIF